MHFFDCQNLIVFAVIMRGNAVYSPYKNNYTTYYLKLAQLRSLQDLTKNFKTKKLSDFKKSFPIFPTMPIRDFLVLCGGRRPIPAETDL